jgi:hypothetical protein
MGNLVQPKPGYTNTTRDLRRYETLSFGKVLSSFSEVLNANVSFLKQPDGEFYDWIEIHNTTGSPISLAGYALSNNAKNPAKWVFPDVTLDAGEYLTVMASGKNVSDAQKKNNLATNFRLSSAGDVVLLFQPDGTILDKLLVPKGHADVSYGRTDASLLFYSTPTPNAANSGGVRAMRKSRRLRPPRRVHQRPKRSVEVPEGCNVTYTTDGTVPTESSSRYSGPITVSKTTVLRVRAFERDITAAIRSARRMSSTPAKARLKPQILPAGGEHCHRSKEISGIRIAASMSSERNTPRPPDSSRPTCP